MEGLFWWAAGLCVLLLGALALTLRRLYSLEASRPANVPTPASARAPEGWSKLDELLNMLLALQENGVSHSGAVSREDFGRAVLDCACQLMKCDRGSVMNWDEKEGCLKIVAARSLLTQDSQKLFLRPGEGVAGKAFASGQPIFVADPANDPRYLAPASGDVEPFVSIPLLVKGKPIGVLNLPPASYWTKLFGLPTDQPTWQLVVYSRTGSELVAFPKLRSEGVRVFSGTGDFQISPDGKYVAVRIIKGKDERVAFLNSASGRIRIHDKAAFPIDIDAAGKARIGIVPGTEIEVVELRNILE